MQVLFLNNANSYLVILAKTMIINPSNLLIDEYNPSHKYSLFWDRGESDHILNGGGSVSDIMTILWGVHMSSPVGITRARISAPKRLFWSLSNSFPRASKVNESVRPR